LGRPKVPPATAVAQTKGQMDNFQGLVQEPSARLEFGRAGYEQLKGQLKDRGMNWEKWESEGDRGRFTCTVTDPADPKKTRSYSVNAASELEAMQAVIDQIDRERQK
jgi:hypothetical protein